MDAWIRFREIIKQTQPIVAATLGSFLFLTLLFAWVSISGTSALANMVWCLAAAGGVALAALIRIPESQRRLLTIGAGAAVVLSAATATWAIDSSLRLGASTELLLRGVWLIAALPVIWGAGAGYLLCRIHSQQSSVPQLLGTMTGAVLFAAHAWFTIPFALSVAVLAACVAAGAFFAAETGEKQSSQVINQVSVRRLRMLTSLLNVNAGLGLVAGGMVLNRIFPVSLILLSAGTVVSVVALTLVMLPLLKFAKRPWIVWIGSLAVLAALPWCYTSAIGWNLHLRATISTGPGIILAQGVQLALWAVPFLLATVAASQVVSGAERPAVNVRPAAILTGAAIAWMLSAYGVAPVWLVVSGFSILAIVPAGLMWRVPVASRRFHIVRIAGSLAAVATIISPVVCPPNLAAPARLLFTMRSVAAVHRGVAPEMIPETDAIRMVDSKESPAGTVTTWKMNANLLELRLNGRVVGQTSTDISTTPQPVAEVLTCVLPLVLHQHPGSVLLLDDHSGVARETCEGFPLHQLIVVDSDLNSRLLDTNDTRTQSLSSTPETAIRNSSIESVDVVISMLADPMRTASLSRLTRSWFQAASERLAKDGVFCQRVRQQYLDDDRLLQLLSHVSGAFDQVSVIQLVPGEFALVATNSNLPLLDKRALARMERQHVRRQLGRCGWDWCQLAALTVIDSSDPVGLWNHHPVTESAISSVGTFGLRLGWETAGAVDHWQSIYQLLKPHQRRIAEAVPHGATHDEFRRRISSYAQQVEVLTAFPDEPWIYRKSLKSEMQRNPRPAQETIRDGTLHRHPHPLDEYRKAYLTTLGGLLQRVRSEKLRATEVTALREFSLEYEPLISDFAHHELIRIYELAGHPSPKEEFRHRLHTVNFTHPGDYSVRTIVSALEQLTEQPDLVGRDADRFDQLNSLVQQLIVPWEGRTRFEPRSAIRMQRDVELSVQSAQTALTQMEDLSTNIGIHRDSFLLRRQFVTKALISPLRDYKERMLAHRAKHEPMLMSEEELNDGEVPLLMDLPLTN